MARALMLVVWVCCVHADTMIWSEPNGVVPQPRFQHTAVRFGTNLFVFGGDLSYYTKHADLHVLNINARSWSKPYVYGNLPSAVNGHSAFAWQDQMIVMFGNNGKIVSNRIYSLDVETFEWKRVITRGRVPTPRSYQTVALLDGHVFVFGGYDGRAYLNDLHSWQVYDEKTNQTGEWKKLEQRGVVPEIRAGAASAVHGRKLYMFGGFEVSIYKNDFFVLDMDKLVWSRVWYNQGSCPPPPARSMATLTLIGNSLLLFGGVHCMSDGSCTYLNDVHKYDLSLGVLHSLDAQDPQPPARYGHTATVSGSKVIVFGGAAFPSLYNDVFEYDIYDDTWFMPTGYPPYARKQHSLDVVSVDGRPHLLLFGGKHGSGGFSNNAHLFSLDDSVWTHPKSIGPPPAIGHHATAVKDNTTLVVFGGYDGKRSFNSLYMASPSHETVSWVLVTADGVVPPPCHGHAVVTSADRWLQFGGVDCQGDNCTFFNTIYALAHDSLSWTVVDPMGTSPHPRASHTWTTLEPKRHYLFGGIGPQFVNYNDLYFFDEDMMSWVLVDSIGPKPSPRYGHVTYAHKGRMIVFGGASCTSVTECTFFNDLHMFNPAKKSWKKMDVQGDFPAPRVSAVGVALGEVLYLHGGASKDKIFGELLTVQPDATVPNNTIVFGVGASGGVAGRNVRFFVQTVDSFMANRTLGGDVINVTVIPTTRLAVARLQGVPIHVTVDDGGQGQYVVQYTTNVTDRFSVTVFVNGVATTPMIADIVADLPDPNNTVLMGPGMARCSAGFECSFDVELYDQYRNKVHRPVPVDVQFTGPHPVFKLLDDAVPGTPALRYTPKKIGNYSVSVRLRLMDVLQSPFNITVFPGTPSPTHSHVSGDGLKASQSGELGKVTLELFDDFDNLVGKGGFTVEASLEGPESLVAAVTDRGTGVYDITYTALITGEYRLSITLLGQPLQGSPFVVQVVNAPISPANTFAYGAGLRYAVAGYRAYFTVQAADDFGNNMTHGGANLSVVFAGPKDTKALCNVTDHENGVYTVSFVSALAGQFLLSATLFHPKFGHQSIHDSPFIGNVVAGGADPTKSYVYVKDPQTPLGVSVLRVVMGVHNYFYIQAVDRYGNLKTNGGDKFSAQLDGPVSHDVYITDNMDGTYVGTFIAPAKGRFSLKIFFGNVPLKDTPLAVNSRANFDICPNGCNDRGECINNECRCYAGYEGADCSIEANKCPANCMGNGACVNSTCLCYPGFSGVSCGIEAPKCPNNCSRHGVCKEAGCKCDDGFRGVDCSDGSLRCPDACMGNGECVGGECLCYPGFVGANCATRKAFCPKGCSTHGSCLNTGVCDCHVGWGGLDCAQDLLQKDSGAAGNALRPDLPAKLSRK